MSQLVRDREPLPVKIATRVLNLVNFDHLEATNNRSDPPILNLQKRGDRVQCTRTTRALLRLLHLCP